MEFIDYKDEVFRILEKYGRSVPDSASSLEPMFESYLKGISPIDYIRSFSMVNESSDNKFNDYYNRAVNKLKKYGYNVIKMPGELMESMISLYNEGYSVSTAANYILEELDKNTIKLETKKDQKKAALMNKLLILVHDIDNCALKDVEINKDETSAVLKIKIFEMRNEINTDVKSYIRELNKYFKPYVRQNVDNGSRIDILGYSVNQRSVYVTVRMKVDLIDSENFSINETANIIKMYIEIFRTFAEQYQNIV